MMTVDANIAVIFPGQGSQSIGMMNKLAATYPEVKSIFAQASDRLGYDLWDKVYNGPESDLNQTEIAQPALLTAAYATWTLWKRKTSHLPALLAGHSLGEYSALVCADVISFTDAVGLVAERGKYMQKAVPTGVGSMAAILGLDDEQVVSICKNMAGNEIVSPANFNSPGQVVISGHNGAVKRTLEAAKTIGAKRTVLLPVSVPSHCMLMKDVADKFANQLNRIQFNDAIIPIVQNVDAIAKTKADELQTGLLAQLYKPVRWVSIIQSMQDKNVTKIIECGPGRVLSGLIKRITRSLETVCIQDSDSLLNAV